MPSMNGFEPMLPGMLEAAQRRLDLTTEMVDLALRALERDRRGLAMVILAAVKSGLTLSPRVVAVVRRALELPPAAR